MIFYFIISFIFALILKNMYNKVYYLLNYYEYKNNGLNQHLYVYFRLNYIISYYVVIDIVYTSSPYCYSNK